MKLTALVVLAAAVVVAITGSAGASDGLTFRGYGTAAIDGELSPEWNGAARYDFQAKRAPAEGGGTVPATLFVMNDATNLYLGLRVAVADIGYSAFDGVFLAPDPYPFAPGSDILRATPGLFEDYHFHQTSPYTWDWLADVADGGTRDGAAAVRQYSDYAVFEVAHPLNSADDLHDFSLTIPNRITFYAAFQHCVAGTCVGTFMPNSGLAEVVAVSGNRVPPDTTITAGPAEGSQTADWGNWEFVGNDDVTPVGDLTYECKVDDDDWSSCESPYGPATTVDGWHTLRVRALDDMLNADPVPAQRHWRIDTVSPSRPRVSRRGTTFRFSATDRGTPSRSLRFRCAIDAKQLHACGSRIAPPLSARRHILRVRAVDPAGNQSDVRVFRFVVRR